VGDSAVILMEYSPPLFTVTLWNHGTPPGVTVPMNGSTVFFDGSTTPPQLIDGPMHRDTS